MRTAKLFPVVLSIAVLGLWACGGGSTGTSSGTGTTTGGSTTGGTSGTGSTGSSSGGDAGLPGLGQSCSQSTTPDPCRAFGLACNQLDDGTVSCQLPRELQPCCVSGSCSDAGVLADPGCAVADPPLHCQPGFLSGGVAVNLCVNLCTVTADCPDVVTTCQGSPKLCFLNFCGPGSSPTNGTTYYGACNSGGTGDGTCIPFNPTGSPGFCAASGPVALWQPCSDARPDGGTSEVCASGSTCAVFPVSSGPPKTLCAPLCAPTGATVSGPPCGAGETCFSAGSVDFGYCLTDCGAGQACPAPTACQSLGSQALKECLP
jgi:hypothetical protein